MASIDEKKKNVAELEEKFKSSKTAIFADYRGLKVADATDLRKNCREAGVDFRVVKNTLAKIAAENAGLQELDKMLVGPTAVAFGLEDPVIPAKVLVDFAKKNRTLEIKGGMVEGRFVELPEIKTLAELPGRDVLISQVMCGLNAPIANLCSVLQGPIRKLVYALQAIQDQKAAG
jgi:large subunit ribosomal protein L10